MPSATKFYLCRSNNTNAPVSGRGTWLQGSVPYVPLWPTKAGGGAPTTVSALETSATNPNTVILGIGITPPLKAQTISGTINILAGVQESDAAADFYWKLHVWVWRPSTAVAGGALVATLLNNYEENTTNEWPTTAAGTALQAPQTLSTQAIEEGDRIVVEMGCVARNSVSTSYTARLNFGAVDDAPPSGVALSDLTLGSTAVDTLAGYVTFSSALDLSDTIPTNIDCASADDTALNTLPATIIVPDVVQIPTDNIQPTGSFLGAGSELYSPVWWKWVATFTGTMRFETFPILNGSATGLYDTSLTVYTGSCGALTQESYAVGLNGFGAVVLTSVTSGVTYWIRAASRFWLPSAGSSGTAVASLTFHARQVVEPANNNFANREVIASLPFSTTTDTSLATAEAAEQVSSDTGIYSDDEKRHSVWYEYTPPSDQDVRLDTAGTQVSAMIAVWTGTVLGSLTLVSAAGWDNNPFGVNFDGANIVAHLTGGISYKIQISCSNLLQSIGHNRGGSGLQLALSVVTGSATNRSCATAAALTSPIAIDFTGVPDYQFQDTIMNGLDPLDDDGKMLWFTWTANVSGAVSFRPTTTFLGGNSIGIHSAVFSGSCGSLSFINKFLRANDPTDQLTWTAVSGTTYHIQVLSYGRVEFVATMEVGGAILPPPPTGSHYIEASIGMQARSQIFQFGLWTEQLAINSDSGPVIDVRMVWHGSTFAGYTLVDSRWVFLIFLYGTPFTVTDPSLGIPCTAIIDRPWEDPLIGTDGTGPATGPSVDPYRRYVLKVRTSTYHEETASYDFDGAASFEMDGAVLWSVSGIQIKTKRSGVSDQNLTVLYPVWGDIDNAWAADRAITPTYTGAEEVPTDPHMVFVDTFNSGIDFGFWTFLSRYGTTDPPAATSNGLNASGAASTVHLAEEIFHHFASFAATVTPPATPPTTPNPTLINGAMCCTSVPGLPSPGMMPEVVSDPFWIPSCTGGGVVPTAPDLSLVERWDY